MESAPCGLFRLQKRTNQPQGTWGRKGWERKRESVWRRHCIREKQTKDPNGGLGGWSGGLPMNLSLEKAVLKSCHGVDTEAL